MAQDKEPQFRHHYCPKCKQRYHWSQLVNENYCPKCGYDIVRRWSRPTWRRTREGVSR